MSTRRNLLVLGGLIGGTIVLQNLRAPIADFFAVGFEFSPIAGAPGFRRLGDDAGQTSGGAFDPFIGLETGAAIRPAEPKTLRPRLCDLLFHGDRARVPIAIFTDYNCPYCRVIEGTLEELAAEDPDISLHFHNLPLLGTESVLGARAALAARDQGAFDDMHTRLMAPGLVITRDLIAAEAARLNLDTGALLRAIDSTPITAQIAQSLGLGEVFGIIGTPGMIVGRSFVLGVISKTRLRRLIKLERESGPLPC